MDSFKLLVILSCAMSHSLIVCLDNSPCSPLSPGEYKGTNPSLFFTVQEMTSNELETAVEDPTRVKLEATRSLLQIHGDMSRDEYTLHIDNHNFFNPLDYFQWVTDNGRTYLQLSTGIDRDGYTASADDDIAVIFFSLTCIPYNKTIDEGITYDAKIFIADVNDNTPSFVNTPDTIYISEATPKDSVITRLSTVDLDSNTDKNITFSLLSETDKFSIDDTSGVVRLGTSLDFDGTQANNSFILVVKVVDGGPVPFLSATTTIEVRVSDEDDQGPAFEYPGCFKYRGRCSWPKYTTKLDVTKDTPLDFMPVPNKGHGMENIRARDLDVGIGSDIIFRIASTTPAGHEHRFRVDTTKLSNGLHQARVTPTETKVYAQGFQIFLAAEEQTTNKHFTMAVIFFQNVKDQSNDQSVMQEPTEYEEDYTDREMGLIAACAVLATLVFCLVVCLGCVCLRRHNTLNTKGGSMNGHSDTRM